MESVKSKKSNLNKFSKEVLIQFISQRWLTDSNYNELEQLAKDEEFNNDQIKMKTLKKQSDDSFKEYTELNNKYDIEFEKVKLIKDPNQQLKALDETKKISDKSDEAWKKYQKFNGQYMKLILKG